MDNLNYNEQLDNMINENSISLINSKALSTAKLIEMFFVKTTMLISNSKSTKFATLNDESFDKNIITNIETFYTNYLQNEQIIKLWQNIDVNLLLDPNSKQPPPLVIETYLDLINLEPNQNLYIRKNDSNNPLITSFSNNNAQIASSTLVCKGGKKSEVVLERWLLELDATDSTPDALHFNTFNDDSTAENSLEQFVNEKFLIFLRYLVSLLKILPAQELFERLINEEKTGKFPSIKVCTRILDGSKPILSKGRIGLSKPIIQSNESHLEQKNVIPLETNLGLLRVNVSYRKNVNFFVSDHHHHQQQQQVSAAQPHKVIKTDNLSHTSGQQGAAHINLYNSPVFQQASSESISSLLSAEQYAGSAGRKSLNSYNSNINRGSLQYPSTFKVGSVGSIASNSLTRNPSNSSVIATLRAQRSSNGSNNGLPNPPTHLQNQLSSDSIISPSNTDNHSLSSPTDHRTPLVYEQFKRKPSFKGERKSSKGDVSTHLSRKQSDLSDNNPDIKEFLDLISDDGSKNASIIKSSSLATNNNNNSSNSKAQSITDSLMRFKMMKLEPFEADSNNDNNSLGVSITTSPDSASILKRRNMSSGSISEPHHYDSDKRKYSANAEESKIQSDFNQFGFSPTRGFDAEQIKATLDRSRRGSIDSSKRMALSTSRNSLYSHYEQEHEEDLDDEYIPGFRRSYNNDTGIVESLNSVTGPRDIHHRRKRTSSSSSSFAYSIPKFSNSINSNKTSVSSVSNQAISFSSQTASRRPSIDAYAEPTTETSTVYANFEKPKSYSKNSGSSVAIARNMYSSTSPKTKSPLEHEAARLEHVVTDESIKKSGNYISSFDNQNSKMNENLKDCNSSNQNKNQHNNLNDDDDDLLFFMGDSS